MDSGALSVIAAAALIPSEWDDAMARDIAIIADNDTPLTWYRDRVQARALGAWSVYIGGERVASVLWRIDREAYGECFVIVAAVGGHPAFDLTSLVLPKIEHIAKGSGCLAVRFHTTRRGLAAKGAMQGYSAAEWVMRKRIDNVA